MPSLQARLARVLLRNTMRKPMERALQRPNLERSYRRIVSGGPLLFGRVPIGFACVPADDGNGVRGEWILPPRGRATRVVLYLHGGAYVGCTIEGYRSVTTAFARRCETRVFALDYRLAPEHPFPAALDDAVAAYRWLLEKAIGPERIVIAGDSAGGGLVLSTLLALRERGLPQPSGAVAIAPWVDLLATGDSIVENADSDDIVAPDGGQNRFAHLYMGGGALDDPRASALYADLTGIAPLLIQASDIEMLRDDAVRLDAKARASGVDSSLRLWHGVPHVWHLFASMPETREAFDDIAAFVKKVSP